MGSVINYVIYGLFGLFLLIGVLYGLGRGLTKSLIRFFTVICAGVITYFVTPLLVSPISAINIASLDISIAGSSIKTVGDIIDNYIKSVAIASAAAEASPTALNLIKALPLAILSLVLFTVFFFVFKFIMWILYKIAVVIIYRKREKGQKNTYKGFGAIVGGLQGIVVCAIMLLPMFGTINLINKELNYISEYTPNTVATVSYEITENESALENASLKNVEELITKTATNTPSDDLISKAKDYTKGLDDNFIIISLNFLGYDKLSIATFNNLTKMTIGAQETNLGVELDIFTMIYARFNDIQKAGLNNFSAVQTKEANEIIDMCMASPIYGNIVYEITQSFCNSWLSTEKTFLTIPLPTLTGAVDDLADTLAINLKSDTINDLKVDLKSVVKVVEVSSSNKFIDKIINKTETKDLMLTIGNDDFISRLVNAMLQGKAIKNSVPTLIQTGLNFVMPTLNVPENESKVTEETINNKLTKFYNNLQASSALTADAEVLSGFKNAFTLIGLTADDTYLNTMVTNKASFVTKELAVAYFANEDTKWGTTGIVKPNIITADDIKITKKTSDITWTTENVVLTKIFSNIASVYSGLNSTAEGSAIDKIDFNKLGAVFDGIRDSELLDGVDQKLIIAIMESNFFNDISVGDNFILTLHDTTKYNALNFTTFFGTVKSSITLAKQLKETATDPTKVVESGNVTDLLNGLSDESTAEVITELATPENLEKSGVNPETAEAVSSLVDVIVDNDVETNPVPTSEEEKQTATDAVVSIVNAMENSNKEGVQIFASKAKVDEFITNMLASDYVYNVTKDKGEEMGFKTGTTTNLNTEERSWLEEVLVEKDEAGADDTKLVAIANMFAILYVPQA